MPHALIVDDDDQFQNAVVEVVSELGFTVDRADSLDTARQLIDQTLPDVALIDLGLPDGPGTDLFKHLCESTDVVMVTGNATLESAVHALREGATDYLVKPVDLQRLRALLGNVARRSELQEEIGSLRSELRELGRFGAIVGSSPAMQVLYDSLSRVAPTGASVLIQGESGTGKELVAETIHRLSRRRKHRFVAVNCGAISPQLIESELFGHEKGSFTGANRTHRGYFEQATGGTLFLDEITEMPWELQVKLLRVLETGRVTRVGAEEELAVDVRLLAATNRDPQQAVRDGRLRQDLLYRLSVFPLYLPPLRDREGDIALLARHFLSEHNRLEGSSKRFTPDAIDILMQREWRGNVRELKNVVERAFIMADSQIDAASIAAELPAPGPDGGLSSPQHADLTHEGEVLHIAPGTSIDEAERRLIIATLEAFGGNKEKAAGILQISLKTLYNRLKEYRYPGVRRQKP